MRRNGASPVQYTGPNLLILQVAGTGAAFSGRGEQSAVRKAQVGSSFPASDRRRRFLPHGKQWGPDTITGSAGMGRFCRERYLVLRERSSSQARTQSLPDALAR